MKNVPYAIAVSTVFGLCCMPGCTHKSIPEPSTPLSTGSNPETAKASSRPTVTLVVQINRIVDDEETTESLHQFPDPDAATVRKHVTNIDWTNPQVRPCVGVTRPADGSVNQILIKGTLGKPNADGELRAYRLGVIDNEVAFRISPPLESVDAAVDLLLLFLHDDSTLPHMVEHWEDAESE